MSRSRIKRSLTPFLAGLAMSMAAPLLAASAPAAEPRGRIEASPDLEVVAAGVRFDAELDLLIFEQRVRGQVGATVPKARGSMDGAPVLAYVFPTTLPAADVGFGGTEGTVALVATSHPDFDDTPLWDENANGRLDDDGVVFHTHWVVLVPDERVPGGLAAAPLDEDGPRPATHPGMPIQLDSPGFSAVLRGDTLRIVVPAYRIGGKRDFRFDALTAYLEVGTTDDRPMLGVYHVYGVLSGDLSLPYRVSSR